MFSFLIAAQLEKNLGNVSDMCWNYFMIGASGLDCNLEMINSNPTEDDEENPLWLSQKTWENICALSECIGEFEGFSDAIEGNLDEWKEWFFGKNLIEKVPQEWKEKLSTF